MCLLFAASVTIRAHAMIMLWDSLSAAATAAPAAAVPQSSMDFVRFIQIKYNIGGYILLVFPWFL